MDFATAFSDKRQIVLTDFSWHTQRTSTHVDQFQFHNAQFTPSGSGGAVWIDISHRITFTSVSGHLAGRNSNSRRSENPCSSGQPSRCSGVVAEAAITGSGSAAPWSTWTARRWRRAAAASSPRLLDTALPPSSTPPTWPSTRRRRRAALAEVPAARLPPPRRRRRRRARARPAGTRRTCWATRRPGPGPPRRRSAAAGCWRAAVDVRGDRERDAADIEPDTHQTSRDY